MSRIYGAGVIVLRLPSYSKYANLLGPGNQRYQAIGVLRTLFI